MYKLILNNKAFNVLLNVSYVLAIIVLLAMAGFGFPRDYKVYVNVFFIALLLIGVIKTIAKYFFDEGIILRVFIFDAVSILFICFCIYRQLGGYDLYFVSKYLQVAVVLKLVREIATPSFNFKRSFITPPQLFIISFLVLVFGGALLLMLPKASHMPLSFLDALFTATSAVCVTGLTVVDSFELNKEYSIIEVITPSELVGKTFDEIEFKKRHNILVMTIIQNKEEASFLGQYKIVPQVQGFPSSATVIQNNDVLVIYGANEDIYKFLKKFNMGNM